MSQSMRSPRLYSLMSQGRLLRFNKGATVGSTSEGNAIMMVTKGYVKRYMILNDGSIGVQIVYGQRDVFSLTKTYLALLDFRLYDGPEVYYYKAMTDTRLLALDLDILRSAVQEDPLIYKELFAEAGCHLKTCVQSIENISLGTAYARVAHQLLFMARQFGEETDKGIRLALPLTHQDLSDILGTTRETVTLAIAKLRHKGLLLSSRDLTVVSMERLAEEAYS